MKIAIIGAGFTGLASGYKLSQKGHNVTVFEKEEKPGGLAIGFKEPNWKWSLEKHYHHIFTSDYSIRNLANEIGHKLIFKRPKTSILIDEKLHQLDSPISLLAFSKLSLFDRLRTGIVLLYLKLTPFWKSLESLTSENFLKLTMGGKSWDLLWRPLFEKKFGKYAKNIPASWFWARIKKRSASLGYPEGGFESLARSVEEKIKQNGGIFKYNVAVKEISKEGNKFKLVTGSDVFYFDKVICTLPSFLFAKIAPSLPESYKKSILGLKGLGAVNLVLILTKKFLEDNSYWVNINEMNYPFLGVMEQTNFMDSKFYGGDRIIYVGNYVPPDHKYFEKSASELLDEFLPFLKRINPHFTKKFVKKALVFKAPFAQPVIPLNYSKILPQVETPIEGLYLANIQQVYPWDRGTNYAVELGEKVVQKI